MLLPRSFFLRPNVVQIARDLLGKYIVTRINGVITSGMICETEAYAGVTDRDIPHAVLIRGIMPAEGKETMLERAEKVKISKDFGIGPVKVAKLLGIHYSNSGLDLTSTNENAQVAIWVEDRSISVNPADIIAGPRIGVNYAGEDAALPYRFRILFAIK